MERLLLKPTNATPLIWLDAVRGRGVIAGNSLPENASEFYNQLINWMDRHLPSIVVPMHWEFRLHYFNTSSMKGLYQVLLRIKASMDQGHTHVVVWDVEEQDEFMLEAGENFIELIGIPMEFRTLSEKAAALETEKVAMALLQLQRSE